jgi:hypothetical protein
MFDPTEVLMTSEIINQWPKTFEEAVERVIITLTAEQKEQVRQTPEDQLLHFHENMGRWIRNMFGLWGGNKALIEALGRQHPDTASTLIIQAVWRRLRAPVIEEERREE